MKNNKILLEVCVDSAESALAAQKGGAARIELCDDLVEGGTTPSAGMIAVARKHLSIKIHVIIRPRGGDFCYSRLEVEVMKRDIQVARELGADGVVFGLLQPAGNIDIERTRELVEWARPLSVTFHRAFDMTRDPRRALEDLIRLGVDRVLTSGQEQEVPEGLILIGELVRQAGDRIIVMPGGGGITEDNVAQIAAGSGAREIHLGDATRVESPMQFRNERVFMGSVYAPMEYSRLITDPARIGRIVSRLASICS